MANLCRAQVQACAIRVARLEDDGTPDVGSNNLYVSAALTSLTITPEIETGDEFIVKNACGSICVNYKDCDRTKRYTTEINLCTPDPELHELMAGGVVLTNGSAVGWGAPYLNDPVCPNGVSVEVWTKQITTGNAQDPDLPYARWIFPRMTLSPGARTFENGPVLSSFSGDLKENENWGNGPLNDWVVDSDRSYAWLPDDDIPTAVCGYQSIAAS